MQNQRNVGGKIIEIDSQHKGRRPISKGGHEERCAPVHDRLGAGLKPKIN